ncbi:protein NYNRIN-like [Eriocheir sinensis]|uniref:protein NYNRIN-like n=1 Tax=Eriocheir sinensis TaxID=95602 RepID=UPI0021C9426A|nr:protein NYNRIN-like [Eriocheir sinensis]
MIGDIGAHKPDDPVCTSISTPQEQDARPPLRTTPVTQDSSNSLQVVSSPSESELACVVQTRVASARVRRLHPPVLSDLQPLKVTPADFARLQETCPSLGAVRAKATAGLPDVARNGASYKFSWTNGLLYRDCVASSRPGKVGTRTLVLPSDCRQIVLQVAHESPLAGHFSHRKTESKVSDNFFWPGMWADIRDYCRSYDICQRKSYKGQVKPVPLQPLPVVTEPFSRVAVDVVGPLSPPSADGHWYILILIDFATGFPEAIPLKDVDSVSVAEALLSLFSRVGIPREILSDRSTQFTSQLMAELHKLLARSLEWHRYLIPTLFALREVPSDRTGLSAFDLLYGRTVRGPLTVLKDLWEDRDLQEEERTSLQYVIELREKLTECAQLAAREADVSTAKYKSYFDLRSQDRRFKPGDEVLVLLPDSTKKFLVSWRGPFKVLERRNKVDYLVDDPRGPKLYHANLLKRYHRRDQVNFAYVMDDTSAPDDDCSPTGPLEAEDPDDLVPRPLVCTVPDSALNPALDINKSLEWNQRSSLEDVLSTFKDVFSQTPGCTNTLQHDIILTTTNRVLTKNYPVPIHLRPYFEKASSSRRPLYTALPW